MADSIIKLKVDSQEYDSKIKRASEGLKAMEQACRKIGGTFEVVEKDELAFVQSLGKMETVSNTTKGQLRELSNALTDLTTMYRGLTNEEKKSPFGEALNKSIKELTERAGNAKDALDDVNASIKNAASDTRVFDQLAGGAKIVTSGFQTLQGASKLLGIEMGDNVEVLAKLQAAMAVTNGLSAIQASLQKQSALMQGVHTAQMALAATAQKAFATATGSATIAQEAFNVVANANPYVLLGSVILTACSALAIFSRNTEEASGETKKLERDQKNLSKAFDSAYDSLAKTITQYKLLKTEWDGLKTLKEKNRFIAEHRGEIDKLTSSVKNTTDAEKFFSEEGTKKFIEAMTLRAKATAYQTILIDKYKEVLELEENKKARQALAAALAAAVGGSQEDIDKAVKAEGDKVDAEIKVAQEAADRIQNEVVKLQKEADALYKGPSNSFTTNVTTKTTKETKTKVDVTQSLTDLQLLKDELKTVENSMAPFGKATDDWKQMNEYAESLRAQIKALNGEKLTTLEQARVDLANLEKIAENLNPFERIKSAKQFIAETLDEIANYKPTDNIEVDEAVMYVNYSTLKSWQGLVEYLENDVLPDYNAVTSEMVTQQQLIDKLNSTPLKLEVSESISQLAILQDQLKTIEESMKNAMNADDYKAMVEARDSVQAQIDTITGGNDKKNGKKKSEKDYSDSGITGFASDINGGLSGISSALTAFGVSQDNGFSKLVEKMGAVITIITSIQTIVTAIEAIDTIGALIPFAHGGKLPHAANGMIPGNYTSGDKNIMFTPGGPVAVNSGEYIFNRAQMGNLASQLQGGGLGNLQLETTLYGEDVRIMLRNNGRRTGRGEYVTSRR